MRTYRIMVGGQQVEVKAPRARVEEFARTLGAARNLGQFCRELWGIKGGEERTSDIMSFFGPSGAPIRDPERYAERCAALMASLVGRVLTGPDLPAIEAEARAIYEDHIPIKDKRRTPEEDAELVRAGREASEAQRAREAEKDRAVVERYGSGQTVEVSAGSTAVVFRLTFDNSDIMTDYFDRHAVYGPAFLLGILPGVKARQTEAAARSIVARFLELAGLELSWHTETYSMGHGNYLLGPQPEAGALTIPEKTRTYDTAAGGLFSVEVSFRRVYSTPETFQAFKGYPGAPSPASAQDEAPADVVATDRALVTRNVAKAGVEIRFPAKPAAEVLTALKASGWRWSRFGGCWYKPDRNGTYAEALRIAGAPAGAEGDGLAACVAAGLGEGRDFCPSDNT